jgi:copper chaperone CopZ
MSTVTLKILGMHCVSCSINIDGELEDTPGVMRATTSYARAESVVEYDPEKITVEAMQKIIAKLGYELTQ